MINKKSLAKEMSNKFDCSEKEALEFTEKLFDSIQEFLSKGQTVNIPGFGHFENVVRKGRKTIHPRIPNAFIQVADAHVVKFRPGRTLRLTVKNKEQV